MRALDELLSDDDAWPSLHAWAEGGNDVEFIEADRADGERTLTALQVTTRSPLGALAFHAAVVFVDHRWVRVLGAGGAEIGASLLDPVPGGPSPPPERDEALIIATDVLGGIFVLNGGGFPGERGEVLYLGPDTLQWEPLELGNTALLKWLFGGDIGSFYEGRRWSGWETDIASVDASSAVYTYPPLFTRGVDIEKVAKKPVPVGELWSQWLDFRERLGIEQ